MTIERTIVFDRVTHIDEIINIDRLYDLYMSDWMQTYEIIHTLNEDNIKLLTDSNRGVTMLIGAMFFRKNDNIEAVISHIVALEAHYEFLVLKAHETITDKNFCAAMDAKDFGTMLETWNSALEFVTILIMAKMEKVEVDLSHVLNFLEIKPDAFKYLWQMSPDTARAAWKATRQDK